jgi:hypothetical protein
MIGKLFDVAIAIGATLLSFYGGYLLSKGVWHSFLSGTLKTPIGLIECTNTPSAFWGKLIWRSILALMCLSVPTVWWVMVISN